MKEPRPPGTLAVATPTQSHRGGTIFERFRLDEPWDGEHNRSLLAEMPIVFDCPSDRTIGRDRDQGRDAETEMTGYRVVIGPETVFPSDASRVTFEDVTDGLSNTLLVVESRDRVPWTKPEDLPFDAIDPLVGLGSHHGYPDDGLNALFGDGSVRYLRITIDPMVLRNLFTRGGGEVIDRGRY